MCVRVSKRLKKIGASSAHTHKGILSERKIHSSYCNCFSFDDQGEVLYFVTRFVTTRFYSSMETPKEQDTFFFMAIDIEKSLYFYVSHRGLCFDVSLPFLGLECRVRSRSSSSSSSLSENRFFWHPTNERIFLCER